MSRRSGAVFLLPLLGTTLFVLLSFSDRPWGQWSWAVDLMTGITVLSGPVLAACAAHLGWTQHRLEVLLGTCPRAAWIPFRCAFQAWCWGVVGYVVSAAVIVALVLDRPHGGPFPLWAAAIGTGVLGVAAAFGACAIHLFPYRLTVIAVGPAVFLAGSFGPHPYADLLRHGPSTGSLAGLTVDPTVWVLQFVGLVALGGALLGVLMAAARRPRTVRSLALPCSLVVVSLGVLLACGTTLDDPGRRRLVVSDERPTVCRGTAPTICVSPSSLYGLVPTERSLRRSVARLRSVGAELPERYEEVLPGYLPPRSVGQLVASVDAGSLRVGARNAATPAGCPQWSDPRIAPEKALLARELVVEWIGVREGEKVLSFDARGQSWLAGAASPAAGAWIRTTVAKLRSCDFATIRMPWTPAKRR